MNLVGILQGRLSSRGTHEQCFPYATWTNEFAWARESGFECLEWLFAGRPEDNPLWSRTGRDLVRSLVDSTGIRIPTLCAHYFLERPLHGVARELRASSLSILEELLEYASEIGVRTVLVPVLEQTTLRTEADANELLTGLAGPLRVAQALGIRMALELDLPAPDSIDLIARSSDRALGIYYDTGNATAQGFDTAAEIHLLGDHLAGVHLKDRVRGGASVVLGTGDTDFQRSITALARVGYRGPLILEANRGTEPIAQANRDLAFVRRQLADAWTTTS